MYILSMKKVFLILTMMMVALIAPSTAYASSEGEGGELKIKETIFHHLGDGYGWEVPFSHHHRIPLPVIVKDYNGDWHCFSSSRVTNGETYEGFYISHGEEYNGKIVGKDASGNVYRPLDFSITKNVFALWISIVVVLVCVLSVARWHRRNGSKAPRKGLGGALEPLRGALEPKLHAKDWVL